MKQHSMFQFDPVVSFLINPAPRLLEEGDDCRTWLSTWPSVEVASSSGAGKDTSPHRECRDPRDEICAQALVREKWEKLRNDMDNPFATAVEIPWPTRRPQVSEGSLGRTSGIRCQQSPGQLPRQAESPTRDAATRSVASTPDSGRGTRL